jgi:hypothetical protein
MNECIIIRKINIQKEWFKDTKPKKIGIGAKTKQFTF